MFSNSYFSHLKIMDIIWNEMIPFKGIKYIERYYRYYPTEMEDWKICSQSKKIKLFYLIT